MTLLPSTLAPFTDQQALVNGDLSPSSSEDGEAGSQFSGPSLHHVLVTTSTGSIGLLTPLDEPTYRRLSTLQTHLTSVLEHPAGLNPRAHRNVETEGSLGARGVVDGDLIMRIGELGAGRRSEVLARAGAEKWMVRSDLEILGGGGLGYF